VLTRIHALAEELTHHSRARYVFSALVALLLVIAVGHLYLIDGLTALYLGLPLWVWVQLLVVFAMLAIAWIAVDVVADATEEGA